MLWLSDLYKGTGLTDVEMKVLRGNGAGNIFRSVSAQEMVFQSVTYGPHFPV